MKSEHEIHTIVGAGQIGRKLAQELHALGHEVRIVRRGAVGTDGPQFDWRRGDITDAAFAREACAGSTVVYNCTNPSDYAKWDGVLLPLHRAVLGAAAQVGARFVGLDCLYMLGLPDAMPMTEDTPLAPCSEKGELRAELVREALLAHERGDVHVAFGRAPDFFGPDSPTSLFGERFLDRLCAGKAVEVFGDPDLPRSYAYTPDVARGLAVLGTDARAREHRVWNLPVLDTTTTREVVEAFFAAVGHAPRMRTIPRWIMTLAGTVSPLARAAKEMLYQWEHPYVLDDSRFRTTFGVDPTPLTDAVADTLAARSQARAA
jgi:nucleoside-diphosphate-sugar epimerase